MATKFVELCWKSRRRRACGLEKKGIADACDVFHNAGADDEGMLGLS